MSKHERNKSSSSGSGGLLESWFGRPKAKSVNYSAGGTISGRPNSAEGDVFDLMELERKINSLTNEEVDAKFMEILEDMNINKDKRAPLLAKPLMERRKMILMHLKGMR